VCSRAVLQNTTAEHTKKATLKNRKMGYCDFIPRKMTMQRIKLSKFYEHECVCERVARCNDK